MLGVTISNDLRWNIHIEEQLKTTRKLVFIILQLKRAGLTQQQLVTIYQAYIRSILMYGYPCFCNLPYSLFKRLQKFENRITILIGCKPILKLKQFCNKLCMNVIKSVVANFSVHPLRSLFRVNNSSRQNRHTKALLPPRCTTERRKNTIVKYL